MDGINKVTPLLTQVRNAYFTVDCGMTYVIRTCEGTFVLIDGGMGEYEEAEHLWDILMSQHTGSAKPVIKAWFITHPHTDHFGGFVAFMDKYGEQVTLERVVYKWPLMNMLSNPQYVSDLSDFDRLMESLDDSVEIVTPYTGQIFEYADAKFEVLFVCDDLYPNMIWNVNDTSLVMMMELAGRKVLWLADAQGAAAEHICQHFTDEQLKCEFLQVGHHGYDGGSDELHRKADPEVLLWPCPDLWFPIVRLWETNDYLIHSPNIRTTIVSGQGEVVIDMTKPVEEFRPYIEVQDGEVIYEETFQSNRVIDLHWSCMIGSSAGCPATKATVRNNACRLETMIANAYAVCQVIQPGQMEKVNDFTLTFSGKLEEGAEKFGLYWDYSSPITFSEEHALWLQPGGDGSFEYRMIADSQKQEVELYLYDRLICQLPYAKCRGFYFILKNATVEIEHIRVVKGV